MTGIAVQQGKVQRPALRPDTLARHRLLDWLHVQIHHRIVLVIADAGYGKTTLLADFSGRTRLRTLWYRIDEDDRDWVTFLSHLVAAGREHDPGFAATTETLLADTGVTAATRDAVLNTFIGELPPMAEHGAVLILDDFHLVDDAPDIKHVVREIVARAPERLTVVFSSRRPPGIPLGKLRAGGEVTELRTDDLRFDRDETARLFSETYGRPLEPDVLADLSARTEGWIASLQLVQAALRDRTPAEIRRMVRNLTGADHELYDYLAEEVVGDLSEELQDFLMRTSILQVVTPELAAFVAEMSVDQARTLIAQAERVGLLSSRGQSSRDSLRYHPLVGDFLRSRLDRSIGATEVAVLHRRIAQTFEDRDWRLACHHFELVGDYPAVARVIQSAVQQILASGEIDAADGYIRGMPHPVDHPAFDVIGSRMELRRGRPDEALARAKSAKASAPASPVVLANLSSVAMMAGAYELAKATSDELSQQSTDSEMAFIGRSVSLLLDITEDGNLADALVALERLRSAQRAQHQQQFEAITAINIGAVLQAMGNAEATLAVANDALMLLGAAARDDEVGSATLLRAWSLAHLGRLEEARRDMSAAAGLQFEFGRAEALIESASIEISYGSADRARSLLEAARPSLSRQTFLVRPFQTIAAQLALREQDFDEARRLLDSIASGPSYLVALKARILCLRAEVAVASNESSQFELLAGAMESAARQSATHLCRSMDALRWIADHRTLGVAARHMPAPDLIPYLSLHAELACAVLGQLEGEAWNLIRLEALRRPERWLPALRVAALAAGDSVVPAARILEVVGTRADVPLLRGLGKRLSRSAHGDLGKALARRVAPRVMVEDQGRVAIKIGEEHVEGTAVRRKVLALLCFLLTKPRFSAAREEALEALWPGAEPSVALNSLNQTVYFLRRVLETDYREELSPGYVRHESDVLWLDRQLVSSRTQLSLDFMNSLPPSPSPDQVTRLLDLYQAPFALDFTYEEWAENYRDSVHTAYLAVIEKAINSDMANGHFERGILVARRALKADPQAEQIEFSLLRLLRLAGAHAAAAEQYAHYSTLLRESYGVEPPAFEDL